MFALMRFCEKTTNSAVLGVEIKPLVMATDVNF